MQIKFLQKKTNFKKTNFYFNSNFYWGLIVCMVFIISLFSALFGYYLFMQVNKEPTVLIQGLDPSQTVKKERLQKASEYFSVREKKSAEILNSSAPVVDPSL
jgi:hypothetical protein